MTQPLLDIPFDHYQRYGAASRLLQALDLPALRVLEVGANRQRLLGQFLPRAACLYTDLHAEGDEKDFVVADATGLPFQDQAFDAVVSLDVLEHIPITLRAQAVAEMARVAGRAVIVGFPPDEPWVRDAELEANGRWRELFDEDYFWLQEHKEFGLVDAEEIAGILEAAGMEVLRFGQGSAVLWASLMGAHFTKVKFPELESLVTAADRLYNSRVFAGDHADQPYREYCVGLRLGEDAERLRSHPPFSAEHDQAAIAVLSELADGLRNLAVRTANSEKEWKSTARLLDACSADLEVAKRNWGDTAACVQQLQGAKDAGDAEWRERDAEWLLRQAQWQEREAINELALQKSGEKYEQLMVEIGALHERLVGNEARAKSEIEALHEQLVGNEARAKSEIEALHEQLVGNEARAKSQLDTLTTLHARSRRKWKMAMAGLTTGGAVIGFLLAWSVF
ncbi:methyltransferase domain-containing protein [Thermomonas sp. HDW16]|nr:methyltransferase domain-containing protein [Thermomonas sp. HDW16]